MKGGYIKLYRKFHEDNAYWKENRVFSKAEAWIDILFLARFADAKLIVDGKIIHVLRGEYVTSELKLSSRWNWSRGKVRRYLNELEMEQMITRKRSSNSTIITVVNYDFYQGDDTTDDTTDEQPTVQPTNIRRTTHGTQNKELKELKELKEGNKEHTPVPEGSGECDPPAGIRKIRGARSDNKTGKGGYTREFEEFWRCYPRKVEKKRAFRCWCSRLKDGFKPEQLVIAARNYTIECKNRKTEERFIKHPSTFLGPDKPFEDYSVSMKVVNRGGTSPGDYQPEGIW